MAPSRLEMLEGFVKKDPNDTFSRYALGMEYIGGGRYDEGIRELRTLVESQPDYVPAYYQLGQACERVGKTGEARAAYEQGMAACRRKNDFKTLGELEFAQQQLMDSGF